MSKKFPSSLQRPFFLFAGRWQAVPFRVLAPHRWPGQSAPKRHSIPILTLPFAIINKSPTKGIIIPNYMTIREAHPAASMPS